MLKLSQYIQFTDMIRCGHDSGVTIWVNLLTDEFEIWDDSYRIDDEDEFQHVGQPGWIAYCPEIFDSTIVESFIETINDSSIRQRMSELFRGRGKYARIKSFFQQTGLIERFYAHESAYVRRLTIDWCQANHIEYEE